MSGYRRLIFIAVALSLVVEAWVPLLAPALSDSKLLRTEIAAAERESQTTGAAHPAKLAVLVGINEYGNPQQIPPLAGSINDVEDMFQVLTTKFEFPRENIKILKGPEATHARIIEAIRKYLIAKAKPGDIVVFHFSGHGSQMKDITGKKISGLDETIVPYDSRDRKGKVFDISGAELHGLLLQLVKKTQNVTFILDSCHSGTLLVRGARVRSIPADTRTPPPPPSYAVETMRGLGNAEEGAPLKYAFIAAATSKESAYEHFAEGKEHGALTYFLVQQLRNAGAGATYQDIMDGVVGNVTSNYPAQHPQLEGAEAGQHVFGDSESLAQAYVLASPGDGLQIRLDSGQVEGATVGSIYEIYQPGARKFAPPEQSVAKVRLTKVDAFDSEGTIISGGRIAPSSRAVERVHRYGTSRMRVYLDHMEQSSTLRSIRNALQPLKHIEVVNDPAACNLQLREVQGKIQTLASDQSPLSISVAVKEPMAVRRLVEQIKAWAKYFNVLSIRNTRSGIDLQFTLKSSETRDPMARMGKPDMGVWEGESVVAMVQNNSEQDVYVAILDLSSDGRISVVYPTESGAHGVLAPGSTLKRTFTTFVPEGRSRVTDILKVFASYKPIDLSPLRQDQIRSGPAEMGEPDPLQELLMDSTGTTRQVAPQPLNLGSWATYQRTLVVKRRN